MDSTSPEYWIDRCHFWIRRSRHWQSASVGYLVVSVIGALVVVPGPSGYGILRLLFFALNALLAVYWVRNRLYWAKQEQHWRERLEYWEFESIRERYS